MATRYPSCGPTHEITICGRKNRDFFALLRERPPFAQQTCADAKEKHLNGKVENTRIPGYYGMSPAACRGTWSCYHICMNPVDFNMAFWTEDESKLGNLKLWRCTLPNQDDHVANERGYFPRKPIKKSQHHAIHHHPPVFVFPHQGLCTKGSMAMLEDTKVCTSGVSEKRRTLKAPEHSEVMISI